MTSLEAGHTSLIARVSVAEEAGIIAEEEFDMVCCSYTDLLGVDRILTQTAYAKNHRNDQSGTV